MSKWSESVAHEMGGGDKSKPKKVVHHIETRRSDTKGDHVHTHHHTHPEHHPAETHTTRGDDEMTQHMLANMGGQGDAEQDPDASAASAAPPASPAPAGAMAAGTPAPVAGAVGA